MLTLGLHVGALHRETDFAHRVHSNFDSAAALLQDGVVLAACRESTLAGVARDKRFPARAIRFCLESAGCALHEVEAIALDQDESALDAIALQRALDNAREPLHTGRAWIAHLFATHLGADVSARLRFVDHTTAHLRAAFAGSAFERAASVCLDGAGGDALAVIAEQDASGVRVLKRIAPGCSLADLIDTVGDVCAFGGAHAADLGAHAAGGDPARFRNVLRKMHALAPGGELYLRERAERLAMLREAGVLQALAPANPAERAAIRRDLAAAVHVVAGDLVAHVVREAQRLSTCRDLCISGELAHDPYLLGRALRAAAFAHLWVAPVADDAGNAVGAAAHVAGAAARSGSAAPLRRARDGAADDAAQRLASWQEFVVSERVPDPDSALAHALAQGKTVAWLQGGAQWDARAASSRALLSDPRRFGTGATDTGAAGAVVCIRRESIGALFECADSAALPRHANVCLMPRSADSVPAAVRQADGSVALHAVDAEDDVLFSALTEFERLTGVGYAVSHPLVGLGGTPVDGVDAAVACLLAHPFDALIVDSHVVQRRVPDHALAGALAGLVPRVAAGRELVRAIPGGETTEYAIARHHETESRRGAQSSLTISRCAFDLLQRHGAQTQLREALESSADAALYKEMIAGWRAGFIELRPASAL